MIGGLSKVSAYRLGFAFVIGMLTFGVPEAEAQDLQAIQAQIDALQATVKGLQRQVTEARAEPLRPGLWRHKSPLS
jgi:hypothetical protein